MRCQFPLLNSKAATLAAAVFAGSVLGTDVPLTPVEELARRAEMVVQGRVNSLEALHDEWGRVLTRIELDVKETWKGPATNRLGVVQGSTVLGERQVKVLGEPHFRLGEEVVLFAVFNPRGEAVTLDLARGKFSVTTNLTTQALTVVSDGARVSGGVALPGQAPMELAELRRRVKAECHE